MSALRSLTLAGLCLGPVPPLAGQEAGLLAARDQTLIQELKPRLGLARDDAVKVVGIVPDPLMAGHDARITQYYRGVRVLGGEGILHQSGPRTRAVTDAFVRGLTLDPRPGLPAAEALALAMADLNPHGLPTRTPTTELLAARLPDGDALVWRVHLELEHGRGETSHRDYLMDAQDGRIRRSWSTLRTGKAAKGQGRSQYSGTVTLNTTETAKGFELRDWTRGRTGNITLNLDHGTDETAGGSLYTSASNDWGDGRNYDGGDTAAGNGETAAVDAHYGLQATWDYYAKVYGRKGIDGSGGAVTMRVHFASEYDNAFWSDACQCVTIGDGSYFKSLDALDVIGHELSHGVCAATANLDYCGESGGLNEANSDIQGSLVEFHARGGSGPLIGNWGGNWTMGEDLARPDHPGPLRYLYKPSLDGSSADAWSPELKYMDVHHSSGPMNRCFFFLSEGSSPNPASDYYTCYLAKGMAGLGNDRAAQIWFRALSHYLTSASDYRDARRACISAAQDLHGAGGAEEQAVWDAFHGINVGPAWGH